MSDNTNNDTRTFTIGADRGVHARRTSDRWTRMMRFLDNDPNGPFAATTPADVRVAINLLRKGR